MNHLGLIEKIEVAIGKPIPVVNCPKCGSFWFTLAFLLWEQRGLSGNFPFILAISFLASYTAIWLELFEGLIDKLYLKLYDKIYSTTDTTDTDALDTNDPMPSVPE